MKRNDKLIIFLLNYYYCRKYFLYWRTKKKENGNNNNAKVLTSKCKFIEIFELINFKFLFSLYKKYI